MLNKGCKGNLENREKWHLTMPLLTVHEKLFITLSEVGYYLTKEYN